MNRRIFLSTATTGALAATIAPAFFSAKKSDTLSFAHFRDRLGHVFIARNKEGKSARLRLVEVDRLKAPRANTESFSLEFESEEGVSLPQDIYSVQSHGAAAYSLMVVPVVRKRSGYGHEVVINRDLS